VFFTRGRADISEHLEAIYDEFPTWPETNELKLFVVLETMLKAKNLIYCLKELGNQLAQTQELF